jgi:hypothetical protein
MLYMMPWPMFRLISLMDDAGLSIVLYYAYFAPLLGIHARVSWGILMHLSGKRWSIGLCEVGSQFLTFAIQFVLIHLARSSYLVLQPETLEYHAPIFW